MSISLRCPGCGKVYEVRDDRAGKQAKCKCGAAMKVPAPKPAEEDAAWEDEVNRALEPSAATGAPQQPPESPASAPAEPTAEPTTASRRSREPQEARSTRPREPAKAAGPPESRWSRVARLAKIDVRRLLKRDPWRAAVGLAGVAYGALAALAFVYAISQEPAVGLFFGRTAHRIAQAALAVAMAIGGVLILKQDKTGPAWAALAAGMYCFIPLWGLLPDLHAAVSSTELLPLLWVAVRYAIPIALMVWCLKEETRRERKEGGE
jgi:hypothetical protein